MRFASCGRDLDTIRSYDFAKKEGNIRLLIRSLGI